ncbi:MAG: hypothetical protein Q9227_001631 [Pyrenula ochraceoflavens]
MAATKSTVLVTGGNNGIGLETCLLLSSQPQYHVIMGSRTLSKGEAAISQIRKTHPDASLSLVQIDIDSDESIGKAVEQVSREHGGKLDILINNAGICPLEFSRQIMREAIETNAVSPACVTEAFLPLLRKAASSSGTARLIYVSSLLGSITHRSNQSGPKQSEDNDYKVYRTSKAALNMVTAVDSVKYGPEGIKVFAYCPGFVTTDLANMREFKASRGVPTPEISARGLLDIASGKRDSEEGGFLNNRDGKDGVHPW